MLYRDVENRLDMSFSVSMEHKHPLLSIIQREFDSVPLHIGTYKEKPYIEVFLQTKNKQIESVASSYNTTKLGDLSVIRIDADEISSVTSAVEEILRVRTASPSSFYFTGNNVFAEFRFHHADIGDMSAIAGNIIDQKNFIRISDMGPDPGAINAINEINFRINLSVVTFEFEIHSTDTAYKTPSVYFDAKYATFEETGITALAFYDYKEEQRIYGSAISEEEGIYKFEFSFPFLIEVWKATNQRYVPRAALIATPKGNKLRVHAFIPVAMTSEFMSIIFETQKKVQTGGFILSGVRKYDQSVWNWI